MLIIILYFFLDREKYAIYPRYIEAQLGSYIILSCNYQIGDYTYIDWEFNKGFIDGYAKKINATTLEIKSAFLNNSGTYTCFGIQDSVLGSNNYLGWSTVKILGVYSIKCKSKSKLF